jgi:hypothetical protein
MVPRALPSTRHWCPSTTLCTPMSANRAFARTSARLCGSSHSGLHQESDNSMPSCTALSLHKAQRQSHALPTAWLQTAGASQGCCLHRNRQCMRLALPGWGCQHPRPPAQTCQSRPSERTQQGANCGTAPGSSSATGLQQRVRCLQLSAVPASRTSAWAGMPAPATHATACSSARSYAAGAAAQHVANYKHDRSVPFQLAEMYGCACAQPYTR